MEEEMVHQAQMSVLSQMHLWQVEEMKDQSQEIRCLLALVEKTLEQLTHPKSPMTEQKTTPSHHKS